MSIFTNCHNNSREREENRKKKKYEKKYLSTVPLNLEESILSRPYRVPKDSSLKRCCSPKEYSIESGSKRA